jgi:hypothetical protein
MSSCCPFRNRICAPASGGPLSLSQIFQATTSSRQITSQLRPDATSVFLTKTDFASGQLTVDSCVRAGRLFTVDQSVVIYVAATISAAKLDEVKSKLRQLFS